MSVALSGDTSKITRAIMGDMSKQQEFGTITEVQLVNLETCDLKQKIEQERLLYVVSSENSDCRLAVLVDKSAVDKEVFSKLDCVMFYAQLYNKLRYPQKIEDCRLKLPFTKEEVEVIPASNLKKGKQKKLREKFREKGLFWGIQFNRKGLAYCIGYKPLLEYWTVAEYYCCYILDRLIREVDSSKLEMTFRHECGFNQYEMLEHHQRMYSYYRNNAPLLKNGNNTEKLKEGSTGEPRARKNKKSKRLSRKEELKIYSLFKYEGESVRTLADMFSCTSKTIRRVLRSYGEEPKREKHHFERYNEEWGEHNLEASEPDGKQDA